MILKGANPVVSHGHSVTSNHLCLLGGLTSCFLFFVSLIGSTICASSWYLVEVKPAHLLTGSAVSRRVKIIIESKLTSKNFLRPSWFSLYHWSCRIDEIPGAWAGTALNLPNVLLPQVNFCLSFSASHRWMRWVASRTSFSAWYSFLTSFWVLYIDFDLVAL